MRAKIGVLTISDRASCGIYEDKGGVEVMRVIDEWVVSEKEFDYRVISDDFEGIKSTLTDMALCGCDLILTTGGTGPAVRDVTPEATEAISQKLMPGFGEVMRAASLKYVPTAILSRQTAGILNKTLIVNLPGNPKAIRECMEPIFGAVPYCLDLIGGAYLECDESKITVFRPKK